VKRSLVLLATLVIGSFVVPLIGQEHADQKSLAFEVASIKSAQGEIPRKTPSDCRFPRRGRFVGFGELRYLIACAYGILPSRDRQEISGGPSWIDTELFQVEAQASESDTPAFTVSEGLLMVRTLLAERFKLAVHRETRDTPIFAMVRANREGTLGPRLRQTATDCISWIEGGRHGPPPGWQSGPPPLAADLPCSRQVVNESTIRASGIPVSRLADLLSSRVGRPVQDRTGLAGYYDLDLHFAPENVTRQPTDGRLELFPATDPSGSSIFTAIQEQLGVKLEPAKAPVAVLVIDHVERPTPD